MRMRPRKDFREGAKGPKQMPKIEAKPSRAKNTYAELSWGQQRQKGWGLRPSQPRQRVARHAESLKNCLEVDDLTWVNVKMPGGETTTEGQKYAKHTYINLLSRMKISNRFLHCTTESSEVQRFQLSIIFYSMKKSYLIMALNLLLTMSQLMSPQPCTRNIKVLSIQRGGAFLRLLIASASRHSYFELLDLAYVGVCDDCRGTSWRCWWTIVF